jgi:hypothetical protein
VYCKTMISWGSCELYFTVCRYDGHEEGLWLHCVQYSGSGWVYQCPYPDWAVLT